MEIILIGSVWYLESSAAFHMIGCRYFFSDMGEKYLEIHIEMGDNKIYSAGKVCALIF